MSALEDNMLLILNIIITSLQVEGSTASQVVRLIGLLLVFASQKVVHNVRNEMAESIVPLRKKTKDRQV